MTEISNHEINRNVKKSITIRAIRIKNCIGCISIEYLSMKMINDDNLLILAKNVKVAENFIRTKTLINWLTKL